MINYLKPQTSKHITKIDGLVRSNTIRRLIKQLTTKAIKKNYLAKPKMMANN